MSGILSKNAKISVKASGDSAFVELADLQSISEIGKDINRIDVTTLTDSNHKYINGLGDYGTITATFIYSNTATSAYRKLTGIGATTEVDFKIELPDTTTFTFDGMVNCKINNVEVDAALTFDAEITICSDVTVTNPS